MQIDFATNTKKQSAESEKKGYSKLKSLWATVTLLEVMKSSLKKKAWW
jgi:hypothetical protein